jgi:hypothetical protein
LPACIAALWSGPAAAASEEPAQEAGAGHWRLVVSPYTLHFRPSPEHKHVWAVGGEFQRDDHYLFGASYFSNSFGQDSGYLYVGRRYPGLLDRPPLFFQWSAGLMYGYKGSYEDKVPFNAKGYSPGALVSLGWQFDRQTSAQLNLLGDAGVMLQLSHDFR